MCFPAVPLVLSCLVIRVGSIYWCYCEGLCFCIMVRKDFLQFKVEAPSLPCAVSTLPLLFSSHLLVYGSAVACLLFPPLLGDFASCWLWFPEGCTVFVFGSDAVLGSQPCSSVITKASCCTSCHKELLLLLVVRILCFSVPILDYFYT